MDTPDDPTAGSTANPSPDATPRRRLRRPATVLGAVAVVATAAVATATVAVALPDTSERSASAQGESRPDETQQGLEKLVESGDGYFPGALANVRQRDGKTRDHTAGVGETATGAEVPRDGEVRIGSNTKTFTAAVVLQLVGEGLVELDEPVETYLPGLLRGQGIDGRNITVRQLLQHTSGLPDYLYILADQGGLLPSLHTYTAPRTMLDLALAKPATFAPGTSWDYSNTNFLVAGLLVEAVSKRPLREQISDRIVDPLGLERTYFPNVGDETIRGEHPHGYHTDDPAKPLVDVTVADPSLGWAAGQLVSTPSELNRFFVALLAGDVVKQEQLAEMRKTVPAPLYGEGAGYGLGLISQPLSCGGTSWGHGGSITGYSTSNAATDDGRAVTVATTRLPAEQGQLDALNDIVDGALCD